MTPYPTRRGFTLIELLVVIAIIAVLISLLLPAVQQAREAARRAKCQNNMMQMAIAMQNYDMTFGMLPPGTVNEKGPIENKVNTEAYHVSWTIQILPYLELSTVFNHFNFDQGVYDKLNWAPQQRMISMYLCPSAVNDIGPKNIGDISYAGCHSGPTVPIDKDNDGLLFLNSSITYDEIPDGSAYTILLGEHSEKTVVWGWSSGTRDTLRNCGTAPNNGGLKLYVEPDMTSYGGMFGGGPGMGMSPMEQPPAEPEVDESVEASKPPTDAEVKKRKALLHVGGFNSEHTSGANFVLADGQIKFISETIDATVFQHLGSRNDGSMPVAF